MVGPEAQMCLGSVLSGGFPGEEPGQVDFQVKSPAPPHRHSLGGRMAVSRVEKEEQTGWGWGWALDLSPSSATDAGGPEADPCLV